MDGPWQIGHMTAREYGRKAIDSARQMRTIDGSLELIACGSSGPDMPTFLEWDREVLEECFPLVDAISLHRYYGNSAGGEIRGDSRNYLVMNLAMEQPIDQGAGVCDYVQKRTKLPFPKHWSGLVAVVPGLMPYLCEKQTDHSPAAEWSCRPVQGHRNAAHSVIEPTPI